MLPVFSYSWKTGVFHSKNKLKLLFKINCYFARWTYYFYTHLWIDFNIINVHTEVGILFACLGNISHWLGLSIREGYYQYHCYKISYSTQSCKILKLKIIPSIYWGHLINCTHVPIISLFISLWNFAINFTLFLYVVGVETFFKEEKYEN